MISGKIEVSAAIADLTDIQQRQLPYALARALSTTARQAADAIKAGLPQRFTLRNSWTQRGAGWIGARKQDTTPTAFVTFDRDYMVRQQFGGEKVSLKGNFIAVPVPALRAKIIPAHLRPKFLLGGDLQGLLRVAAFKSARTRQRRMATFGKGFILVKGNRKFIVQRTGPGPHDIRVLYVLVPLVRVLARLGMDETTRKTVQENFAKNFSDSMTQAVATARR